MSIAGPVDRPSSAGSHRVRASESDVSAASVGPGEPSPAPRLPVSRRTVLGAALAGGAGIAAVRIAVYPRLDELIHGTRTAAGGRGDWISPLRSEPARVAHLLRRTTFGASMAEFEAAARDGYVKTVDRLLET